MITVAVVSTLSLFSSKSLNFFGRELPPSLRKHDDNLNNCHRTEPNFVQLIWAKSVFKLDK